MGSDPRKKLHLNITIAKMPILSRITNVGHNASIRNGMPEVFQAVRA